MHKCTIPEGDGGSALAAAATHILCSLKSMANPGEGASALDYAASACGMLGLLAFVTGFVPQLLKNHRRQSVEGLSFLLVLSWFLGDATNFLGAILTRQKSTIVLTGLWFCCMSVITLMQYFYLWLLDKGYLARAQGHGVSSHGGRTDQPHNTDNDDSASSHDVNTAGNIGSRGQGHQGNDDDEGEGGEGGSGSDSDGGRQPLLPSTARGGKDTEKEAGPEPANAVKNSGEPVYPQVNAKRRGDGTSPAALTTVRVVSTVGMVACAMASRLAGHNVNSLTTDIDSSASNLDIAQSSSMTSLEGRHGHGSQQLVARGRKVMQSAFVVADESTYQVVFSELSSTGETSTTEPERKFVKPKDSNERILGQIFAWTSGSIYVMGRFPQIIENHKNRSTDALSLLNFAICVFGNVMYCLSIALTFPPLDQTFIKETLPYIVGSAGTVVLDLVILFQAAMFGSLTFE